MDSSPYLRFSIGQPHTIPPTVSNYTIGSTSQLHNRNAQRQHRSRDREREGRSFPIPLTVARMYGLESPSYLTKQINRRSEETVPTERRLNVNSLAQPHSYIVNYTFVRSYVKGLSPHSRFQSTLLALGNTRINGHIPNKQASEARLVGFTTWSLPVKANSGQLKNTRFGASVEARP